MEFRKRFFKLDKPVAFRQAHKVAGQNSDTYLEHPQYEGFELIILNKVNIFGKFFRINIYSYP